MQQTNRRQPQRRRISVVGGLVQIEIIQRRNAVVAAGWQAENFQRAIGQHLVDVHVRAGAGAALQRIHDDETAEVAIGQFAAGAVNGIGLRRIVRPRAERAVGAGAGGFDFAVSAGEFGMNGAPRERKIFQRPLRVDAMQRLRRNRQFAETIPFDAKGVVHGRIRQTRRVRFCARGRQVRWRSCRFCRAWWPVRGSPASRRPFSCPARRSPSDIPCSSTARSGCNVP